MNTTRVTISASREELLLGLELCIARSVGRLAIKKLPRMEELEREGVGGERA